MEANRTHTSTLASQQKKILPYSLADPVVIVITAGLAHGALNRVVVELKEPVAPPDFCAQQYVGEAPVILNFYGVGALAKYFIDAVRILT